MLSSSPGRQIWPPIMNIQFSLVVGRDNNFKVFKIFEFHNSAIGYFEGALAGWESGLQLRLLKYF